MVLNVSLDGVIHPAVIQHSSSQHDEFENKLALVEVQDPVYQHPLIIYDDYQTNSLDLQINCIKQGYFLHHIQNIVPYKNEQLTK